MPKAPKAKVGGDKKVIHPNSRKATYLARKSFHDKRINQTKIQTSAKLELQAEKLLWFQKNLNSEKQEFTKADLNILVQSYKDRFEEELEQIRIVRSVGNRKANQHIPRETAIQMTLEKEKRELDEGVFEVPDILNPKNLQHFRLWGGEIKKLSTIKLKKISIHDLVTEDGEAVKNMSHE